MRYVCRKGLREIERRKKRRRGEEEKREGGGPRRKGNNAKQHILYPPPMSPGNEAAKVHVLCKKNIFLTPSETGISPTVYSYLLLSSSS